MTAKCDTRADRVRRLNGWLAQISDAPLWHRPAWLDATVAEDSWDVVLLTHDEEVVAALPYVLMKRRALGLFPYTVIGQPSLTQMLGPWWPQDQAVTLDERHRRIRSLYAGLPTADAYRQNWVPEIATWLPLHWDGYRQTTRYTYRIPLTNSKDERMRALRPSVRNKLRKADREGVVVRQATGTQATQALKRLIAATFARQELTVPYPPELLDRILAIKDPGIESRIFEARANDRSIAMTLVVSAGGVAYNLASGSNSAGRASGAGQALLWYALNAEAELGNQIFDFEGSMIEGVERHYRQLGGSPTAYHHVERFHRRDIRLGVALREALRP